MNWYKTSQQGEWWIIDASAHYADADVGDINHSGYVIESILSNYDIISERFDLSKENEETLRSRGLTDEEINVVLDKTDPRIYGMKTLGWKRVAGRNIQTQTLTESDLKDIDYGLWDAYEQELANDNETEFNIEVMGNQKYYSNVPYSVISSHNPMALREYGRVYAECFNLKKYAQEDWYTEEVAKTTTDPEILARILRRGKDDFVSYIAVRNPNCPPEVLVEVLRRSKEDYVSIYAAYNPNCPPDALAEVLRRGKDDEVSYNAAKNPNCPPEALAEVVRRGKNDLISYYAAENINCPLPEKFKWMRDTGRLTKFDPKKHIMEYDSKPTEDEDLKKLEEMVKGSNKNWYKIAQIWNIQTGNGIEDKISSIYELEYKYSALRDRPFNGLEQRKQNILNELSNRLESVINDVKDVLLAVFGKWLKGHALFEPDTWAIQRVEELADELDDKSLYESMLGEYNRVVIHGNKPYSSWGQQNYDKLFVDLLNKAWRNSEQFPKLSLIFEGAVNDYKEMQKEELYSEGHKQFGENVDKKFRNQEQAERWIDKNYTIDNVDADILGIDSIECFVGIARNLGYSQEILVEFYKNFIFPTWLQYWQERGIEEIRKDIENVYKQLQNIDSNNVGNALAVISLALNSSHQSGEMLDYISEYSGGSGSAKEMKNFLTEMSSGVHTEEWNKELRDIGVQI